MDDAEAAGEGDRGGLELLPVLQLRDGFHALDSGPHTRVHLVVAQSSRYRDAARAHPPSPLSETLNLYFCDCACRKLRVEPSLPSNPTELRTGTLPEFCAPRKDTGFSHETVAIGGLQREATPV